MEREIVSLVDFKMYKKYNYLVKSLKSTYNKVIFSSDEKSHGVKVKVYDDFSKINIGKEIIVPIEFSINRELVSFKLKDKEGNDKYVLFDKNLSPSNGDIVICDAKGKKSICRYFNLKVKIMIASLDKSESLVYNEEDIKFYGTAVGMVNSI